MEHTVNINQELPLFITNESESHSTVTDIHRALGGNRGPKWADRFGKALFEWSNKNITKPIKTLSLFSGAGGLDIGFHDAGFKIERLIEIEYRFVKTLMENSSTESYFHNCQIFCMDICDYKPEQNLEVEFVIGSPPCQSFSAAGRRAAGVVGTNEKRGKLFEEYVRLLKTLSPKGFLFENVYGLTGAQGANHGRR